MWPVGWVIYVDITSSTEGCQFAIMTHWVIWKMPSSTPSHLLALFFCGVASCVIVRPSHVWRDYVYLLCKTQQVQTCTFRPDISAACRNLPRPAAQNVQTASKQVASLHVLKHHKRPVAIKQPVWALGVPLSHGRSATSVQTEISQEP